LINIYIRYCWAVKIEVLSDEWVFEGVAGESYSIILNMLGQVLTLGNVAVMDNANLL